VLIRGVAATDRAGELLEASDEATKLAVYLGRHQRIEGRPGGTMAGGDIPSASGNSATVRLPGYGRSDQHHGRGELPQRPQHRSLAIHRDIRDQAASHLPNRQGKTGICGMSRSGGQAWQQPVLQGFRDGSRASPARPQHRGVSGSSPGLAIGWKRKATLASVGEPAP
jgi:hypothetical protein